MKNATKKVALATIIYQRFQKKKNRKLKFNFLMLYYIDGA